MRRINKLTLVAFFLIAILFLLSVPLLRMINGNNFIFGVETYQYLQQAQAPQTIFDYLVNILVSNFSLTVVSVVFPLIIALLSLLIITLLLKYFVRTSYEYYYTLAIIILTPLFLVAHIGLNIYSLIFLFGLLTTYLYIKQNPFYLLTLGLLFAFDTFSGILAGIFLFLAEWVPGEKKKSFIVALSLILISVIFAFISIQTPLHLPNFLSVNGLFLFFGGKFGYSFFLIILGLVGMTLSVEFTTTTTRLMQLIIFVLSVFYEPLRLFGVFLLAIYAAVAFNHLLERKWSSDFIGQLTIVLLFCILIFSTSTFLKESFQEAPTKEQINALQTIGDLGGQTVFAYPSMNPFVKYFSGLSTIDDASLVINLSQSRNYAVIKENFLRYNVSYVFVDSQMRNLWHKSEEGLLFVMENNDDFSKIYAEDIIIYVYNPDSLA